MTLHAFAEVVVFLLSITISYMVTLFRIRFFVYTILPQQKLDEIADNERINKIRSAHIASASHDLRVPIQGFRSIMDLVRLDGGSVSPDLLDMAEAAVQMMSFMVDNSIDIAKIDSGVSPAPLITAIDVCSVYDPNPPPSGPFRPHISFDRIFFLRFLILKCAGWRSARTWQTRTFSVPPSAAPSLWI